MICVLTHFSFNTRLLSRYNEDKWVNKHKKESSCCWIYVCVWMKETRIEGESRNNKCNGIITQRNLQFSDPTNHHHARWSFLSSSCIIAFFWLLFVYFSTFILFSRWWSVIVSIICFLLKNVTALHSKNKCTRLN